MEKLILKNICTFIPKKTAAVEDLQAIHFVLETLPQTGEEQRLSISRIHYVLDGEGILTTRYGEFPLKAGDIFFCLPAMPFSLRSGKNFRYTYVGYLGVRGNQLADRCKISEKNCIFRNFTELKPLWENALPVPTEYSDVRAESVLLYTFSAIGARYLKGKDQTSILDAAAKVKKYVDEHFSAPELSLASICDVFSYSTKYVSAIFKQQFKVGISEYINTLRIQHACSLIDNGFTFIKDIAFLCGYNDPLYFSKVFKANIGCSPKKFIQERQ